MEFTFTENTLSALDRLQKDLRDLIESLEASKANGDSPVKGQSPVQATAVTLEEVRKVLVEKARGGKNDAVKKLLEHFNAASLPEVDPADYAELLELGRKL